MFGFLKRKQITQIYTDGGCLYNGQKHAKAAWGFYDETNKYTEGDKLVVTEGNATNNKAELMALIKALEYSVKTEKKNIKIFSDSKYVIYCTLGIWQRKKNRAYFLRIDDLCKKLDSIELNWVAGHSGNKGNDRADAVCCKLLGIPPGLKFGNIKTKKKYHAKKNF